MPPRRPPSPLSLEICSPQTADLDTDDHIASDDELDNASRDSRCRRIEKLAEACRGGTPLYILSASLRGPFDQGWVNPWSKNRKRKANSECESGLYQKSQEAESPVEQETDPRRRQHPRRCAASSIAPPESDTVSSVRLRYSISPERQGRSARPPPNRLKRKTPGAKEPQAQDSSQICKQNSDDWLKRNPNHLRIAQVDPPSSPTDSLPCRVDGRAPKRSIESSSRRRHISPARSAADQKQTVSRPANNSSVTPRSEPAAYSHTPHGTSRFHGSSPDVPAEVQGAANRETSLRIVSSSSHVPKSEHRRWKKRSSKRRRSKSSSILKANDANPSLSTHPGNIDNPGSRERNSPKEDVATMEHDQAGHNDQTAFLAGDSKASDGLRGPCSMNSKTDRFTAEETGDRFPSAQQMPKDPTVTDCEPSLHSTIVPKGNPGHGDTSPSAELSTQAALLLAQNSFQNGLNTPEHANAMTPERKQRRSQSQSRHQSHQCFVTPFYRLNTPNPDANESDGAGAGGLHMMGTQYMVDAATPLAFSAEKSNRRPGASAKSKPSSKMRKKSSFAMSPSLNWSSTNGNGTLSDHRSAEAGTNSRDMRHQPADHQPESQLSALPFTLTGSTPPTGQDGQGPEPAASFNLSQAIAEAGSWLRQSFDLNMEMKECNKSGPPSSADTRRSAMNLDAIR